MKYRSSSHVRYRQIHLCDMMALWNGMMIGILMQQRSGQSPQLLTLFHAFSTALHRETTLPELLQSLVMRSVQMVPQAAAGCFITFDESAQSFHIEYSYGYAFPSMLAEILFDTHTSTLADILQTHMQTILKHEDHIAWLPEQWQQQYTQANNQTLSIESVAVPVHDPKKLLGILVIERFEGERFEMADAELISNFTRQATLAIHKVQLYQENLLITKALDDELQSVGKVQKDLLPAEVPTIPNLDWFTFYQPATRAGGDYYDFIPLPDGKWAILIADVTGHGAPAAVIAAMIKVILHHLLETEDNPDTILQEANRQIRKHIDSQYFVTLFLGIIDPAENKMIFVSAGHEPPMKYSMTAKKVEELKNTKGFPLRLIDKNSFDIQEVLLQSGDFFVFYTDGVTELFNEEEQVFSFTALEQSIQTANHTSAQSVGESILADMEEFRGKAEIYDDITLLVLHIQEQD